jgi:Ca2+-transporting ATPase
MATRNWHSHDLDQILPPVVSGGERVSFDLHHIQRAARPFMLEVKPALRKPSMTGNPSIRGLSSAAAARQLAADGPNELPQNRPRRWRDMLREATREPMFRLLLAATAVYLLLGELHEGLFLLAMVLVTLGLTLYQDRKTSHALERLRELSSPTALVLRDGLRQHIDSRALAAGDVLILDEGNLVPADAELISCDGLQMDESLLTGESFAVPKQAAGGSGADSARVFAASLVVAGHGLARVTATGQRTAVGRIGTALLELDPAASPMQAQVRRLTVRFAWYGLALSALFVLVFGIARGDWLQALLAGIALAMSMLPEEFPVVLTVFPALGACRLARAQVLTRRLDAIATLGSVSVLCVDKTGTLTENRMAVACLQAGGQLLELELELAQAGRPAWPAPHRELAEWAVLASAAVPVDPMEQAIVALAPELQQRQGWQPLRDYALAPGLPMMTRVWQAPGQAGCLVAAKGAPETVLALCGLEPAAAARLAQQTAAMAGRGLRVLAVAWARVDGGDLPAAQTGFRFQLAGLVGLADPLRAEIPTAIAQCQRAGVRVLMVTGDHPVTAAAIARQAGLPAGPLLTGTQLQQMDDAALGARLVGASVCARITPEQKLRIVTTLQAGGEVVAMTGDGVNDAPALKAAHVGIAMGRRGTDVARAAAALVLLDDRFSSIVQAIRGGRRIYDNMRKAVAYIIATHVPIAGMAMLPVLLGLPQVLYPMHIVFLELIIDPACSLAFENEQEEGDLMARPPRPAGSPLFSWRDAARSLAQGGCTLALAMAGYAWACTLLPEAQARALAFAMLVIGNLLLIATNRSPRRNLLAGLRTPNPIAWGVSGGAVALLLLCLYQPDLSRIFRFAPPSAAALAMLAGASGCTLLCLEALKRWRAAP